MIMFAVASGSFAFGYVVCAILSASRMADEVTKAHIDGIKQGKEIANSRWLSQRVGMKP